MASSSVVRGVPYSAEGSCQWSIVWPQPQSVELPGVIPLESLRPATMLVHPLIMVLAEKITTAIDRGEANTRWRDFAGIDVLAGVHHVDAAQLRASLQAVAGYRRVQLAPLLSDTPGRPGPGLSD